MTIGIGGAGSKLAVQLDPDATAVNVSETELSKTEAKHRILAVVHAARGQLRGSRKNPQIGRDAFLSVKRELLHLIRGNTVLGSTGGGTGNGILAGILDELTAMEQVPENDKTVFGLILPHAELEPAEFINNTISFLEGPLSEAIDSGNTGNIFLLSNRLKFESRLAELAYNERLSESLNVFLSIPHKGEHCNLVDGHIDYEDFAQFVARPYFNHFTYFDYDPETPFETQLSENYNPYLLTPDNPIEALFLLELPPGADPSSFYDVLEYFAKTDVNPIYSVIENPERKAPFITVSLLYFRKPAQLVQDFHKVSEEHAQARVRKSLEQHVVLPKLQVNMESEVKRMAKQQGTDEQEVLSILKRLGKI